MERLRGFLQACGNRLRLFMSDRYGTDQLNLALLVLYLMLCLISSLTNILFFNLLGIAVVILVFYRMLSRDHYRRAQENRFFLEKAEPVLRFLRQQRLRLTDRQHRYYYCPCCRQMLRVPRGRGKITVICPRCRTSIQRKS